MTVLCLVIGSAGVICLFAESADTVVGILLIVTGLVSLPGLLVAAFGQFAGRLGHLQARPGSRCC